ncbi:unnamed protein product, partial [Rotaria sp. Silwood1]
MDVSPDGERTSGEMSRTTGSVKLPDKDDIVAPGLREADSNDPETSWYSTYTYHSPAPIRTQNSYPSEAFYVLEL